MEFQLPSLTENMNLYDIILNSTLSRIFLFLQELIDFLWFFYIIHKFNNPPIAANNIPTPKKNITPATLLVYE